jgi:hypothetical protein
LLAGAPDPALNLQACKNRWPGCDRTRLTLVELTEVAHAAHMREVSDCRNGLVSCDPARLTPAEAIALAVARHDGNVVDCKEGIGACDHTRLTQGSSADSSPSGTASTRSPSRGSSETPP